MKLSTISRVFWYPLLIPFAVFMQCRKVNTTEISRLIVDDIAPAGGTGGTLVTITGEGFSLILTEDTVTFNNLPAQVIKATDTSMVVVVPQGGSTGRVTVTVRNNIAEGPVFTYQEENQLEIISIQPDGGYPFSSTLCKTTVITGKYFGEKNQDSKILLLENENQNEEDHMQAQIESWTNSEIKINFCGDYNGAGYSPMYLKIKQNGKQAGAYIIFQAELDQLGTYNVSTLTGDGSAGLRMEWELRQNLIILPEWRWIRTEIYLLPMN